MLSPWQTKPVVGAGFDRSMVNEALGNIIDSWPGHTRKGGRAKLMPFIDGTTEQRGAEGTLV